MRLKEINFKTYESKSVPGLHFCGELVDVDGVTGGFNFMHCWGSGFAAGTNAAAPTSTSESAATLIRGIPFEKPTSPASLDRWVLSSELAAEPKSSTT